VDAAASGHTGQRKFYENADEKARSEKTRLFRTLALAAVNTVQMLLLSKQI